MAIDPNIILSGNQMAQPRLPDVNAMMQTRTAGMENIYNIEQQRAEQARAAAKAQEAAMAEAMLPSVMAAYKNPTDAGLDQAAGLMPAEVREHFAPFLSKLKSIPDPATRRAILESELAKDEAGRAVLQRVMTPYQEATLGVERGRLELSKAELEQRRAEANKPETMTPYQQAQIDLEREKLRRGETPSADYTTVETAEGIFLLDKKTGKMIPATAGAPATGEGPIDVGQPPQVLQPKAAKSEAATESERLAGYNAGRALDAAKRISIAITTDPEATAPGLIETAVGRFVDPNILRGEERQRVSAAQRELIDALLTLATGAAYNKEQLEGQMESYIPKWSDQPGTREDKRMALLGLIQNAKIKAGRAWTPEMDAAFGQLLTPLGGKTDLQPPPAGTTTGRIPQITSDEEFDALPSGAEFIDPEGVRRRKP